MHIFTYNNKLRFFITNKKPLEFTMISRAFIICKISKIEKKTHKNLNSLKFYKKYKFF